MELVTHKKFKGGHLMPWGKGTVVGGVLSSPNFRQDVLDTFFALHRPRLCSTNNPPSSEVIGVAALAHPDLVIEIVAVAALPD